MGKRPSRTSRACRNVTNASRRTNCAFLGGHSPARRTSHALLASPQTLTVHDARGSRPASHARDNGRTQAAFGGFTRCCFARSALSPSPPPPRLESPANQTGHRRRRNNFVSHVPRRVPLASQGRRFFAPWRWSRHFITQSARSTRLGIVYLIARCFACCHRAACYIGFLHEPALAGMMWVHTAAVLLACGVFSTSAATRTYNLTLHSGERSPGQSAFASESPCI